MGGNIKTSFNSNRIILPDDIINCT